MELCDGTLEEFILGTDFGSSNCRTVSQILNIMIQILNGLIFIHRNGEVHRDLKPRNSFLFSLTWLILLVLHSSAYRIWKIADFGLTSVGESAQLQTTLHAGGTEGYRAPELIMGDKQRYNNRTDIWALGCIFHELLVGKKVFSNDWELIQQLHRQTSLRLVQQRYLDGHWLSELSHMLQIDPNERKSSLELIETFAFDYELTMTGDYVRCSLPPSIIPYRSYLHNVAPIKLIAFRDDGSLFAVVGLRDDSIYVSNIRQGLSIIDLQMPKASIIAGFTFGRGDFDNLLVVSVPSDKRLLFWNMETGQEIQSYETLQSVFSLSFDNSGSHLACGTHEGSISILAIARVGLHGTQLQITPKINFGNYGYRIRQVGYYGDRNLFSLHMDFPLAIITIWDSVTGGSICQIKCKASRFRTRSRWTSRVPPTVQLRFHPIRPEVLVASSHFSENRVGRYDTISGHYIGIPDFGCIKDLAYSPSGNYILSSHRLQKLEIWDSNTFEKLHTIHQVGGGPLWFCKGKMQTCVLLSPDAETGRPGLWCVNIEEVLR